MGNQFSISLTSNSVNNIKDQLEKGVNPNEIFDGSYPVLFNVTNKDQLENLLDNGADIDLVSNGKTALTRAVVKGNLFLVRMLLLYGANVNPVLSSNIGPNTAGTEIKFSDTSHILTEEMSTLLQIYGYPTTISLNGGPAFNKEKMLAQITEQLKALPLGLNYPAGYVAFMRKDDQQLLDGILDSARIYDHLSRNLDYNHAALWMVENNFGLQVLDEETACTC